MSDIEARIYVDQDWKERVQREKEEARRKQQSPTQSPSADETAPSPETAAMKEDAASGEVHPAFEALVSTLATQAMYCLGFIGGPGQGQVVINLEQAKEAVDMLLMLRDKTRGNLVAEESALMAETLSELQRLFAARVQQAQAQAMQQAGIAPGMLRNPPQ